MRNSFSPPTHSILTWPRSNCDCRCVSVVYIFPASRCGQPANSRPDQLHPDVFTKTTFTLHIHNASSHLMLLLWNALAGVVSFAHICGTSHFPPTCYGMIHQWFAFSRALEPHCFFSSHAGFTGTRVVTFFFPFNFLLLLLPPSALALLQPTLGSLRWNEITRSLGLPLLTLFMGPLSSGLCYPPPPKNLPFP